MQGLFYPFSRDLVRLPCIQLLAKRVGKTGAWYDPNIQPDFGGSFFDIHNDKLKQQEIYDPDGDLIHPRDMYNVLRPGTLIEYICHLHVFNIVNRNSKTPGSNRVSNNILTRRLMLMFNLISITKFSSMKPTYSSSPTSRHAFVLDPMFR